MNAENQHQRLPAKIHLARQVEQQVAVDVDQAGGVLGTLEIAGEPVQIAGDSGQHDQDSFVLRADLRGCVSAGAPTRSTIQVSLLPPPCEEFTTREPLTRATRVKPPVVTWVDLPCSMNGRRSTWRGSMVLPHKVGVVESARVGWAT